MTPVSAPHCGRGPDPTTEVTVVVADAYPNFSICGIPYYISGEVAHWRNLAHRTLEPLQSHRDAGAPQHHRYQDRCLRPPPARGRRDRCRGPDRLRPACGRDRRRLGAARPSRALSVPMHWVRSTACTCSTRWATPSSWCAHSRRINRPAWSEPVGAGYIGLEMAEGLSARGLSVAQIDNCPRCSRQSIRAWALS